ncbi:MAG: glycosyltransferase, partial [Candidatus Omnitrophica bacterium]|nr:glycosyltransferase [Candidatus Omnitrophota bacterium]
VSLKSTLAQAGKLKLLENNRNRGKGFSVKKGILACLGEYLLISDADLSTPIEEIEKLFSYIKSGYDIVIGSRSVKDSDVKIHQPWYREGMGKIFNLFVRLLIVNEFSDTQCGFKLFKGDIARDIASFMKIDGFCFDVEMLYLAELRKSSIKEAGVIWLNSPQSRVKVVDSSVHMFLDLLKIKALHR